jgi:4-hydroxy-3-methylbut-2-enyl diphosphate reductase
VGGRKSSNTARLADVGNQRGVTSYHIERPEEIDQNWLEGVTNVGVTAGASTPDDVIQEVVEYLANNGFTPPEGGIRPVDEDYVPAF